MASTRMGKTALLLLSLASGSAFLQGGAAGTHLPAKSVLPAFAPSPVLPKGMRGRSCVGPASAARLGGIRMASHFEDLTPKGRTKARDDVTVFMPSFKAPSDVNKLNKKAWEERVEAPADEGGGDAEHDYLQEETERTLDWIFVKDALVSCGAMRHKKDF